MEKKNIYQKLMDVRVAFHKLELKKSGLNKFAGFKYFELGDFLVPATKLLNEEGLCTIVAGTKKSPNSKYLNPANLFKPLFLSSSL